MSRYDDDVHGDRVRWCSICGTEHFESALNEDLVCRKCVDVELALIESDAAELTAEAA